MLPLHSLAFEDSNFYIIDEVGFSQAVFLCIIVRKVQKGHKKPCLSFFKSIEFKHETEFYQNFFFEDILFGKYKKISKKIKEYQTK